MGLHLLSHRLISILYWHSLLSLIFSLGLILGKHSWLNKLSLELWINHLMKIRGGYSKWWKGWFKFTVFFSSVSKTVGLKQKTSISLNDLDEDFKCLFTPNSVRLRETKKIFLYVSKYWRCIIYWPLCQYWPIQ